MTRAIALLALALAGCGELGTDLGYGVLYTVRCGDETFTDLALIHGTNSFDPRGSDRYGRYMSVRIDGRDHDYPGVPCDYWPQL